MHTIIWWQTHSSLPTLKGVLWLTIGFIPQILIRLSKLFPTTFQVSINKNAARKLVLESYLLSTKYPGGLQPGGYQRMFEDPTHVLHHRMILLSFDLK